MLIISWLVFGAFTLFYALFSAAIIYHLKQYTLPGRHITRVAMSVFLFLSLLFWLFALYFVFRIPS